MSAMRPALSPEDVEDVRYAAKHFEKHARTASKVAPGTDGVNWDRAARLRGLADRLSALLPPEGT